MGNSAYIVPFVHMSSTLEEIIVRIRSRSDLFVILIHDTPDAHEAAERYGNRSVAEVCSGTEQAEGSRTIRLRNAGHAGYTAAVNAALAWALENTECNDLWIVNDDVLFVRGLPELADIPDDAGLIGVLSNKAGYQSITYSLDDIGDYLYPDLDPEAAAQRYDSYRAGKRTRHIPVPLVHGFCFRISRLCLESVGLLDDRSFVFGYGSDYDLSLRAVQAGFTNYVYTGCFVAHIGAASAGRSGRRIRAIRADHELRKTYGEQYKRAKFVTRERLNRHLSNFVPLTRS